MEAQAELVVCGGNLPADVCPQYHKCYIPRYKANDPNAEGFCIPDAKAFADNYVPPDPQTFLKNNRPSGASGSAGSGGSSNGGSFFPGGDSSDDSQQDPESRRRCILRPDRQTCPHGYTCTRDPAVADSRMGTCVSDETARGPGSFFNRNPGFDDNFDGPISATGFGDEEGDEEVNPPRILPRSPGGFRDPLRRRGPVIPADFDDDAQDFHVSRGMMCLAAQSYLLLFSDFFPLYFLFFSLSLSLSLSLSFSLFHSFSSSPSLSFSLLGDKQPFRITPAMHASHVKMLRDGGRPCAVYGFEVCPPSQKCTPNEHSHSSLGHCQPKPCPCDENFECLNDKCVMRQGKGHVCAMNGSLNCEQNLKCCPTTVKGQRKKEARGAGANKEKKRRGMPIHPRDSAVEVEETGFCVAADAPCPNPESIEKTDSIGIWSRF
jgi:hypothetical protein